MEVRSLASPIKISYYDVNGTLSPNVFELEHEITGIDCTTEDVTIDCLADFDTISFLKTFGVVFRDLFSVGSGGTAFGWKTITSTGASVTRSSESRYGKLNFKTTSTSQAAYVSRNIFVPRKHFTSVSKHQPFNLWLYCDQLASGTNLKGYAAFKDLAGVAADRVLLPWSDVNIPRKIDIGISTESYASKVQDFYANISVGISSGVIVDRNVAMISAFTLPSFMAGNVTDIPFISRHGKDDTTKEGLIVEFDVDDGENVKSYKYRGCNATILENTGMAVDVRAKISFSSKSSSFGE